MGEYIWNITESNVNINAKNLNYYDIGITIPSDEHLTSLYVDDTYNGSLGASSGTSSSLPITLNFYIGSSYTLFATSTNWGSASYSPIVKAGKNVTYSTTFSSTTGKIYCRFLVNSNSAPGVSQTMARGHPFIKFITAKSSHTLTTVASPTGAGTVTAGATMEEGATKQLSATASTGYTFALWTASSGTLSSRTTNPTTFTMGTSNATVTAGFSVNSYTLTVSKGTGIASVTGGGSVAYGSSNAISATLSTGYEFVNWTSNNGGTFASSTSASTSFTMPAGNVTVTANGQGKAYTLTVAKGTGISAVTGGGSVRYTAKAAITATVSTGYTFSKWTSNNGGTFASATSASTSFTMPAGNATVTAAATINTYTLTTTVSPSGGGTVTAGGSITYNSKKQLTATAASGYTFSSWSKSAGTLSSTTTNPTTFTMGTANATVTANFTANTYTLTVNKGTGIASVSGGGSVAYKGTKAISATMSTGY